MSAKKTTMTDIAGDARRDELARKIVRVHGLCDPLGAKGQRRTHDRINRETRARRGVFAAAFASFVACFGIVALTADKPEDAVAAITPRTVAEIPLNDERGTTLRILEPPPAQTPQPHVRTRATS